MRDATGIESANPPAFGKSMLKYFAFRSDFKHLNNGSFGAVPKPVLSAQRYLQDLAEAAPDVFFRYESADLMRKAREVAANLLHADLDTLVLTINATTGVNIVLRNLVFVPGDVILIFSTMYGACAKTVNAVCETTEARQVVIDLAYPVSDEWLLRKFECAIKAEVARGNRVKIAIFDTIVSMPGVRMPYEKLTEICKQYQVLSCIDAAHGIGHIKLDLTALDPDFFVTNLYKWMGAPRGCAAFYVPLRNQCLIRSTLPTSHGFVPIAQREITNPMFSARNSDSAFVNMFNFVGVFDNSPLLSIPAAVEFRQAICGGEDKVMAYCSSIVAEGATYVANKLGTEVMENDGKTLQRGIAMANVRLPLDRANIKLGKLGEMEIVHWIHDKCCTEYNCFMAIFWHNGHWWTRLSGQIWLELDDFKWAAEVLQDLCRRVHDGEHQSG